MDLDALAQRLLDGQAVVYPTSTLPALGALPDASGLDAVFALKGRGEAKPVSVGVRELADVAHLVDVPPLAHALLDAFPRGSLSLILPARSPQDPRLGGTRIAVRRLADPRALALVDRVGPLTATSANPSGEAPAVDTTVAAAQLGLPPEAALPGRCPGGPGSTFLLLEDRAGGVEVTVIRAGEVPSEDVMAWVTSKRA